MSTHMQVGNRLIDVTDMRTVSEADREYVRRAVLNGWNDALDGYALLLDQPVPGLSPTASRLWQAMRLLHTLREPNTIRRLGTDAMTIGNFTVVAFCDYGPTFQHLELRLHIKDTRQLVTSITYSYCLSGENQYRQNDADENSETVSDFVTLVQAELDSMRQSPADVFAHLGMSTATMLAFSRDELCSMRAYRK